MTDINPLIFMPSPRDIEVVKQGLDTVTKYDKLWVKYHPESEAYYVAREYFLEHKEYTHLIINPDDLITNDKLLDRLVEEDCYQHPDWIISGWCPNTIRDKQYDGIDSNVSFHVPTMKNPNQNIYTDFGFIPIVAIEEYLTKQSGPKLIPMEFCGFALTLIPRAIVEEIPFRQFGDCCVDTCFALDLKKRAITQYCDLALKSIHLRAWDNIMVGIKQKALIFEPKKLIATS